MSTELENINRLPAPYGLLINREQHYNFSFEGVKHQGYAGDSIASALIANNQWLLSRSFKYHRPRSALTMAGQDANTLVQLPSDPNVLADREPLSDNVNVMGQNYSGTLAKDLSANISYISRFLPVGFYYKAFFKPRGIWEKWAPLIRKKSGLGKLDTQYEPEYYDKKYKFFDITVVGAGPAGLAAALAAADHGAKVLLVDENPVLGGSLNYARYYAAGEKGAVLRNALVSAVQAHRNIEVLVDSICNAWYADNWLAVIQAKRMFKVRSKQVLMCVGSMEQQIVFHNNDLPGVMMSSAAQRLMHLYGVKPGKEAVVVTGNDDGYGTALDLLEAGVIVKAVIDMREFAGSTPMSESVIAKNVEVKKGFAVFEAKASSNKTHLASVNVRKILGQGVCAEQGQDIACDLLCMAAGFTPSYQLICQAGGQLSYDENKDTFNLTGFPKDFDIAGSVNGVWDVDCAIADAKRKSVGAVNRALNTDFELPQATSLDGTAQSPNFAWPIFPHPKGKEFVDFDEDLQIADIVNAVADGYEHIQLVKRYSTCGMGPSQGRHSALATARLVANASNRSVAQVGVTTARPPFAPERLAHCAGRSFYPTLKSNIHQRHLEAGAQMLHAGAWLRPAFYGAKGTQAASINAEVNNVRNNVGMVDVSTLGGIEVRGPEAGEFLNRFYTFGFVKQPVGRARYALLTNEAGVVIDDGVACRFHQNHYYVTATTGGVGRVYQQMLKWNAQWGLDVDVANVTSAWCGVNIAGPNARKVLEKICRDVDLSAENFPYMGVREGHVANIPARLIRVGFVGELGFEIHAPQHMGEALWDALREAGKEFGIKPFGVEAQRVLRLEKGHIIIGQDTDAMSNPLEVQMSWAVSRKKPFFVGGRTISELEKASIKRTLVGFVVDDPKAPTPLECQLVLAGEKMVGRVTSCNYSPTLNKAIGLAYVPVASSEPDSLITIKASDGLKVNARVVALPFYDPDTLRQEL